MTTKTPIFLSVKSADDFRELLAPLKITGETIVIKPNWFSTHRGNFTEAEVLSAVLSALPADTYKLVVEGYSGFRNDGSRRINLKDQRSDWEWIREQDEWFRETFGITEVLAEHGAKYLSVTEEVWSGRTAPADEVSALVEKKTSSKKKAEPIAHTELYEQVPMRLWELAGATLISLTKIKGGLSLSLKNLFGMVPEPLRLSYHGEDSADLPQSIADIARIYLSIFNVVGVCEAVFSTAVYNEKGALTTDWGNYDLVESAGIACAGRDPLTLDAAVSAIMGEKPKKLHYLQKLGKSYGSYDKKAVTAAVKQYSDLFAPLKR